MNKYIIYIFIFTLISVFIHNKELFNDEMIYADNFYHYLLYAEKDNNLFKNDVVNQSITENKLKKILFNPIVSKLYTYSLYLFKTPKTLSLIIAIISQIFSSLIFLKLLIKILPKTTENKVFIYSILFSIFISTTDFFFPDLRRNIAFLLFILTVYNLYLKNHKFFFLSIFFYLYIYSVSLLFILILILFYLIYITKIEKKYFLWLSIIMAILLLIITKSFDFIKPEIYKIKQGFEWKDDFNININNINFIENYILNLNEYFKAYTYFFYLILCSLIALIVIITKEKISLLKEIFKKEEIILLSSSISAFIFSAFFISPAFASKQISFVIPFLLIISLIKSLNIVDQIKIKITNYITPLFILFFLLIFKPEEQLDKINIEMMNNIKKITETNSVIFAHPSEIFIPYYTQRTMYVIERSEKIVCAASKNHCNEIKRRYDIATEIYYIDSIKKIKEKIKKEKIDYIIVDKKYYYPDYLFRQRPYDRLRKLSIEKYSLNISQKFKLMEYCFRYGEKIGDSTCIINSKKIT